MRQSYTTIAEVIEDFEIHVYMPQPLSTKGRIVNLMLQGTIPGQSAIVYEVNDPAVGIPDATIIAEANKQRK